MARGKTSGRYTPRRSGAGGGGGDSAWLTTYGDMVTLLLAFFVLLYSMSSFDVAKFESFVSGLAIPFGNTTASTTGEGILPGGDGFEGVSTASINDPLPMQPPMSELEVRTPDPAVDRADDAADASDPDDVAEASDPDDVEADEQESRETLDEIEAALEAALTEEGLADLVERRREERGLVVSIASDDVLFALASTEIGELGQRVIRTVARVLRDYPNDALVEGHTDDLPLQRADYTNWNLSTDRAVAVLSEMIDAHRFPPDQIGAVGYGEYRPYVPNDSDAARARNRRVDILVLRPEIRP